MGYVTSFWVLCDTLSQCFISGASVYILRCLYLYSFESYDRLFRLPSSQAQAQMPHSFARRPQCTCIHGYLCRGGSWSQAVQDLPWSLGRQGLLGGGPSRTPSYWATFAPPEPSSTAVLFPSQSFSASSATPVPPASPVPSSFFSTGSVVDSVQTLSPGVHVLRKTTTDRRLFHGLRLSVLCSLGLLGNLAGVSVSPSCLCSCSLFLFLLFGFLALGVLNWSTALVPSFLLCVPRHFLRFFSLFVLICGDEVQSLGEVGGLVPLRF